MGKDLFDMAYKWMGRIPGALALACLVKAPFLAPSVPPDRHDYYRRQGIATGDEKVSTMMPLQLAALLRGMLGILLPPSSVMVIYGIMTEQSIAAVFIAGVIPGLILAFMFMGYAVAVCIRNPEMGPLTKFYIQGKSVVPWPQSGDQLLTVLVLVGLVVGWFTPTESGQLLPLVPSFSPSSKGDLAGRGLRSLFGKQ